MKKLTRLQNLVESSGSPQSNASKAQKSRKIFGSMVDKGDDIHQDLMKVMKSVNALVDGLQSQVIIDFLKDEGFPATQANPVKSKMKIAAKALFDASEAFNRAVGDLEDLHMEVTSTFENND